MIMLMSAQGLEKKIPDTPKGETPVHLRARQIFSTH
jgi:NADH dehydrogenase (ubiquinone) 1 alpha subcomplex subunit 8